MQNAARSSARTASAPSRPSVANSATSARRGQIAAPGRATRRPVRRWAPAASNPPGRRTAVVWTVRFATAVTSAAAASVCPMGLAACTSASARMAAMSTAIFAARRATAAVPRGPAYPVLAMSFVTSSPARPLASVAIREAAIPRVTFATTRIIPAASRQLEMTAAERSAIRAPASSTRSACLDATGSGPAARWPRRARRRPTVAIAYPACRIPTACCGAYKVPTGGPACPRAARVPSTATAASDRCASPRLAPPMDPASRFRRPRRPTLGRRGPTPERATPRRRPRRRQMGESAPFSAKLASRAATAAMAFRASGRVECPAPALAVSATTSSRADGRPRPSRESAPLGGDALGSEATNALGIDHVRRVAIDARLRLGRSRGRL